MYARIRFYYSLMNFYRGIFPLLVVLPCLHLLYFFLNILELLPVGLEAAVLVSLYLLIPLAFLIRGMRTAYKSRGTVVEFLENNYPLDFLLVNLFYERPSISRKFFRATLAKILKPVSFTSLAQIFQLKKALWAGLLLLLLTVFHLYSTDTWQRFSGNVGTILFSGGERQYNLDIPDSVNEGQSLSFSYRGDFPEARVDWGMGSEHGRIFLTNDGVLDLSNVTADVDIQVMLKDGRIEERLQKTVVLNRRPQITDVRTVVIEPVFEKALILSGLTEFEGLPGSLVTTTVRIPTNQQLSRLIIRKGDGSLSGLKPSLGDSSGSFSFRLNGTRSYRLLVENSHGLRNKEPLTMKYISSKNSPPSIKIVRPDREITLDRKLDVPAAFTAEDDIMLSRIYLTLKLFTSYEQQSILSTNIEWTFPKKDDYVRQLLGEVVLPLRSIDFFPGYHVSYYFTAVDYYGLQAHSSTNVIRYLSLSQLYTRQMGQTQEIGTSVAAHAQEAKELKEEYRKLKLAAEKGELKKESLKSYRDKLEKFATKLSRESERLEQVQKSMKKSQAMFSPEVMEKISQIRKELSKIDKDFLQEMTKNLNRMMQDVKFNREDVQNFMQKMNMQDFTRSLDNVHESIKQLQKLQKLDSLEKLAEAIYQKYEDLRAYSTAQEDDEFFNRNKQEVIDDLKDLEKKYNEAKKDLQFDDPEARQIMQELNEQLNGEMSQEMQDYKANKDNRSQQKQFSSDLDKMRKNMSMLSRRMKSVDTERTLAEINSQLSGFNYQVRWNRRLSAGEVYDLDNIDHSFFNREYGEYLSDLNSLTAASRERLYDLTAGYIPGITDFLKVYDDLVTNNREIQRRLDPAQHLRRRKAKIPYDDIGALVSSYNSLLMDLIMLKNYLKQEQDRNSMQNSMESMSEMQKKMGGRMQQMMNCGKMTPQMMEYMKQSAMEQAFIRSLMEKMGQQGRQMQGQGKKKGSKDGQDKTESGMMKELQSIIEEMKKMEGDLKKYDPSMNEKLENRQKKIEEKFLKFNKGMKKKGEKKEEEREAQRPDFEYKAGSGEISDEFKYLQEQLQNLKNIEDYPEEYRTRILKYLEFLENLQKNSPIK